MKKPTKNQHFRNYLTRFLDTDPKSFQDVYVKTLKIILPVKFLDDKIEIDRFNNLVVLDLEAVFNQFEKKEIYKDNKTIKRCKKWMRFGIGFDCKRKGKLKVRKKRASMITREFRLIFKRAKPEVIEKFFQDYSVSELIYFKSIGVFTGDVRRNFLNKRKII